MRPKLQGLTTTASFAVQVLQTVNLERGLSRSRGPDSQGLALSEVEGWLSHMILPKVNLC
jgi:hypothetical protein